MIKIKIITIVAAVFLSSCSDNTQVVYDCSVLNDKDKETMAGMISQCNFGQSIQNCKTSAIESLCKPSIYLIPDSYDGNEIKPANPIKSN
jgi:hypothetical protein